MTNFDDEDFILDDMEEEDRRRARKDLPFDAMPSVISTVLILLTGGLLLLLRGC